MKVKMLSIGLLVMFLGFAPMFALANDQIVSTVTNGTGAQATIVNNGVPNGTIQLWYTYVGSALPCGQFATFNLALLDQAGGNGQAPSYPVTLNLVQNGEGTPVQLSPQFNSLTVSGVGWSYSPAVTVSIDCSKLGVPFDGQSIDGNLNLGTTPSGSHLNTISTIQAHVKLVIPKTACLKLYSFETDQDSGNLLTSVTVVANKSGSVKSTNPGTLSVDGLVVNTCPEQQSIDLSIGLDPKWQTIPNNNPGNATFAYTIDGEIDPNSLGILGSGTPMGQVLCLKGVILPAGDSFLATVHSSIMSGLSNIPVTGNFNLSATAYLAGSGCSGTPLGSNIVDANPALSTMSYTVR